MSGPEAPESPADAASPIPAVAAIVSAAFLVPNALEAAAVAVAAAGPGSGVGIAGLAAGAAMLVATAPGFAAPLLPKAAAPARRLAAFVHPVIVDGLADEGRPLHRAHALLDFATAVVVATAGGITQAGVRPFGSCVVAALAMAVAATALTAYYAVVRPFAARLEVIVAAVQSAALAALCWLTVGAVSGDGTSVSAGTLAAAGIAAEVATFGAPLVLLAAAVWGRFCGEPAETAPAPTAATAVALLSVPSISTNDAAPPALGRTRTTTKGSDSGGRNDAGPAAASSFHRNPLSQRGKGSR